MRGLRRRRPPLGAPLPGRTYVLRSGAIGLVLRVGDRPRREALSHELLWPVEVLTPAGGETWTWGEYSSDGWTELSTLKNSGEYSARSGGEGAGVDEARSATPSPATSGGRGGER